MLKIQKIFEGGVLFTSKKKQYPFYFKNSYKGGAVE